MAICPLAVDWGNVADWAAVVVGFGAAAGTIWVASAANRTARRAAEIAEDAKGIAEQQSHQVLAQQRANAKILGRLLLDEVSQLPARLHSFRSAIPRTVQVQAGKVVVVDPDLLRKVLEDAKWSVVPQSEGVLDRIHDLPDALGPDLATLIGHNNAVRHMAERILSRVVPSPRQFIGNPYPYEYAGHPDDFEVFEEELQCFKRLSIDYAQRFRVFAGVAVGEYSELS